MLRKVNEPQKKKQEDEQIQEIQERETAASEHRWERIRRLTYIIRLANSKDVEENETVVKPSIPWA